MKTVAYVILLSGTDRKRHVHITDRGDALSFTVQFETLVNDKWLPVVRYDTAHGFAHKDILHFDGREEKIGLGSMALKEALVVADRDISQNWQRYKQHFLEEFEK